MPGKQEFKYSVDGKRFESSEARLTGAQIKDRAGVGANFSLFLEGRGKDADRGVGDTEVVDLSKPGNESFYTAPPATFGSMLRDP